MAPKLDCVARATGYEIARKANMPLGGHDWNGDWNSVCRDKNDARRLPSDIIKRIAAQKDVQLAPTGIRIIGAVFCGNNSSAALPYSIILGLSHRHLRS